MQHQSYVARVSPFLNVTPAAEKRDLILVRRVDFVLAGQRDDAMFGQQLYFPGVGMPLLLASCQRARCCSSPSASLPSPLLSSEAHGFVTVVPEHQNVTLPKSCSAESGFAFAAF